MARGRYFPDQITPTYGDFTPNPELREWHEACFREYKLTWQVGPYKCLACNQEIAHGAEVYYIVVGEKPLPGYIRPERRGKQMPWIIHAGVCPAI